MVWNDIIQYLAALRQRKSRASTTMPPYLWEGGRTLPRSHLLHFILQLLEIFLAIDVSWALSPYIDDLEANSWGWAAGGSLFLCKLCNVNFLSVSVLILFFILVLENKINPLRHFLLKRYLCSRFASRVQAAHKASLFVAASKLLKSDSPFLWH